MMTSIYECVHFSFFYHFAIKPHTVPLLHLHIERSIAVIEDFQREEIRVFVILGQYLHHRASSPRFPRTILDDAFREMQSLSATIRHSIRSAEIRQMAHKRVALHLQLVSIRHLNASTSHGMHHSHTNGIVPVSKSGSHLFCPFGSASHLLFRSRTRH